MKNRVLMDYAANCLGNPMSDVFRNAEDMYFQGDFKSAYDLCMKSAEGGDVKCQRLLGWMYFRGNGCVKNDIEALKYFFRAAEEGDAEAFFGIGAVHYEMQHYGDALKYFEKSSRQGFVPANRWMGVLYQLGLGVVKDLNKAKALYLQAAREGSLSAYLQYSLILLHGGEGFFRRIQAIPMLLKFFVMSFVEGWRNKNSQRFM